MARRPSIRQRLRPTTSEESLLCKYQVFLLLVAIGMGPRQIAMTPQYCAPTTPPMPPMLPIIVNNDIPGWSIN